MIGLEHAPVGSIRVISVFLYLSYLFIPGYLVIRLAKLKDHRVTVYFAISFSILIVSQIPYRLTGGSVMMWYGWLHAVMAVTLFSAYFSRFLRLDYFVVKESRGLSEQRVERLGLILVGTGFAIYHFLVGPYTEIPSDFWAHLSRVVDEKYFLKTGVYPAGEDIRVLLDDPGFVHFLHGVVAELLSVHPLVIVREVTLVTSLIFVFVYYQFTLRVIDGLKMTHNKRVATALLATGLMVVSYGVATFSYIRYYAYFPHILNMALAFSSILLVIDYLERAEKKWLYLALAAVLVAIMIIVNRQEAVFALVIIAGISVIRLLRTYTSRGEFDHRVIYRNRIVGYTTLAFTLAVVIAGYDLRHLILGSEDKPIRFTQSGLIDLGRYLRINWQVLIANPTMRFWDTLAPAGIVVYLWYLVRLRWFKGADYLNVGMLSPLVTLFNPLFVWWFLHIASWDPLWRMALVIPVPIVGAVLVIKSFSAPGLVFKSSKFWGSCALSLIFLASLLPWENTLFENTRSRFPSLAALSKTNGEQLWWDLINVVDQVDGKRHLVTDPVTHYVLSSSTRHRLKSPGKAGWQHSRDPFSGDYKDRLLYYGMDGGIVIVNERDGSPSKSGSWSGHWPEDILTVSGRYPSDIKRFLQSRKEEFKQIWKGNSIVAYKVLRDPDDY